MARMIAVLIILTMGQAAQAGDWPMFRHDAGHMGVADDVVEIPLDLLWKNTTGAQDCHPT